MRQGSITKAIGAAALLLCAACGNRHNRAPAIAEAYVGPVTLRIRSDLPLQSSTVASVEHGERLEIIQRRRRFLRVRTKGGAEGWTEENQLLNAAEMADLRDLAARAAKLPSQGTATTFGALNVHTEPAPGSPSFLQVKDGEKFEVLAEVMAPRAAAPRQPLIPKVEKKQPAPRKPARQGKFAPPPMPAPPAPPNNWLDLSKTDLEEDAPPPEPAEAKPVPEDRWSLIRTAGGQAGWVLTRRLQMAIPDEVAQYAEGKRIVSYFPLGYVDDDGAKKAIWLWTTIGAHEPYDFDSFRVFIWSLRRHRYETAYIERNLAGYAPVLIRQVDFSTGSRAHAASGKFPGFSVCTQKADGQLHRREFALLGNVVRYAGETPCQLPASLWVAKAGAVPGTAAPAPAPAAAPTESWTSRFKRRLQAAAGGWWKKESRPSPQ